MTVVGVVVSIFVLFAVSRVILRYREGTLSLGSFLFWIVVWAGVEVVLWVPKSLDALAARIGVGRGIDAVVYASVVMLFYMTYRLYVKAENIEHEITNLVRRLALRDGEGNRNSNERQ